jgi:DNA-binding NarL/FixJ family response regulator
MGAARVSVVLADEQPVVRHGMTSLLSESSDIVVVAEAATAREALRMSVLHRPDVLVLDPELLGVQVSATVREVLRATPGTAVLVFTAADDEDTVVAALRAGARGYLLKNSAGGGIVRAVTGLAEGETVLGPGIADRLVRRIGSRSARLQDMFPELTAREQEVLGLLSAGMGNSAIANQLHLSPKTIANHISVIFGKLHVGSRAEAKALAQGHRRAPLELVRSTPKPLHRHPYPPADGAAAGAGAGAG